MGHNLTYFVSHYGLLALLLLTLIKAIGVPIPIPVDLVVLAGATAAAGGKLVFWQAFGVLLFAMVAGGMIQFILVRGPGRNLLYRFGRFIGLTPGRLDLAFRRVENVGVLGIGFAVVTPGIRTAAIPACGLTTIAARTFALGLLTGTTIFVAFQFFLGYAGVKLVLKLWNTQPHLWLLLVLIPVAATVGWIIIRHRNRHLPRLQTTGVVSDLRASRCPLCWFMKAGADVSHSDQALPPSYLIPLESSPSDGKHAC